MEITGQRRIPAPQERVWRALRDPRVLNRAIPGCEILEQLGEDVYRVVGGARVGPTPVRFDGRLITTESEPPGRWAVRGELEGPAGSLEGDAAIRLVAEGRFTWLEYVLRGGSAGKIAQIAPGLRNAAAETLVREFFDRLAAEIPLADERGADGLATPAIGAASPVRWPWAGVPTIRSQYAGLPLVFWVGSLIWLCVLLLIVSAYF